jgi:hypothetical protein
MSTVRLRHYTLADNRRHEIHAVKDARTLCGVSLAFAADPLETQAPVSCAVCALKYPSVEPGHLPLNDADGDLLMSKVREYGHRMRRVGEARTDEQYLFLSGRADAIYYEIVGLVQGTFEEESPEDDIEQATRHVTH